MTAEEVMESSEEATADPEDGEWEEDEQVSVPVQAKFGLQTTDLRWC